MTGTGVHTGVLCHARWVREDGPLRVRRVDGGGGSEAVISLATAVASQGMTRLALGDGRMVCTVEHALAAVNARGCAQGLTLEVNGPEVPLGDGGALGWCRRVEALGSPTGGLRTRVMQPWEDTVGESGMVLSPGDREVTVWTDFTARGLPMERVRWGGDWCEFVREIAPARTFGFVEDAERLAAAGLARGVSRDSVTVWQAGGVPHKGYARARDRGEPARHKLLDAIGDLALCGGILGRVTLVRPGHARTLELLRRAVAAGVLQMDGERGIY